MSEQISLTKVYSLALGREERDRALTRVELSSEEWRPVAYEAVTWVAKRKAEFTSDAVWFVLYNLWHTPPPHDPRALGPVMKRAAKNGLIQDTGRKKHSTRPECHTREIPIYRSLVVSKEREQ